MKSGTFLLLAGAVSLFSTAIGASAGISYSVAGSTYEENFDSLPKDAPSNANIETLYTNGWTDDTTTLAGTRVSLPGWYLYHPLSPTATPPALPENGANDHQRLRFGPGANTGSFWAFGSSSSATDMAFGSVGSLTVAANDGPMYRALRLINGTGVTLTSFNVTYDGEQWRDGQSATGETQIFEYSLTATLADWYSTAAFVAVPALNFTSPVVAGVSSGGTAVDGNAEGRLQDISATISNISWAPGTELWLRWNDPQLASNADDGLAIDNVRFTAAAPPTVPDAKLAFGRNGGGALQLQWQGAGSTVSWQAQHSTDLQTWTNLGNPAPETSGPMAWVIPAEQLTGGRHYYRLSRVMTP